MNGNQIKRNARIFRYFGAKGRREIITAIQSHFEPGFREYREPFCGSAGIMFSLDININRWINDVNRNLIAVYLALQDRPVEFIKMCADILPAKWCRKTQRWMEATVVNSRGTHYPARLNHLFNELLNDQSADLALRFLFLNRCAMNGRVVLNPSYRSRSHFSNPAGWSHGLIDRLTHTAECLRDVRITCSDFEILFDEPGRNIQIFADPPYMVDTEAAMSAKLYEYGFAMADHLRLRDAVKRCQHNVLLSYDDHPIIRDLYRDFFIHEASWSYTSRADRSKKKELLITNYPVNFFQ